MRRRSTLTVCLVIALALAVSTAAYAIEPVTGGLLILGNQLLSDARTKPVDANTVSLRPVYNAYMGDDFLGGCVDTRTVVAGVPQGSTLVFEPGNSSRVDILGFEVTTNSSALPDRVGMYFDPRQVEEYVKIRLLKPSLVEAANIPMKDGCPVVPEGNVLVKYVADQHPRYCKWQLPLQTAGLPTGVYTGTVRVFFTDRIRDGFLKLKEKSVVRQEESPFEFIVLDQQYWARAVNDPQLQQALKLTYGLVGGPPSIGQLALPVSPRAAAQMSGGAPVNPQAMQTPPAPAPAPQPVKEVQPQRPTEKPVTLVLLCGKSRQVIIAGLDMSIVSKGTVIRFRRNGSPVVDAKVDAVSSDRVTCQASGKAVVKDGDSISIIGGK